MPTAGTRRPLQAAGGNRVSLIFLRSSRLLPRLQSFPPPSNPTPESQPPTSVRSLYFQARCVRVFSVILTIKFFLFSLPGAPPPL